MCKLLIFLLCSLRIHNALKGIPDDRDGLFDTIQRSKNHYQKRAYQCIKCMVALFSNCPVAYQILQVISFISVSLLILCSSVIQWWIFCYKNIFLWRVGAGFLQSFSYLQNHCELNPFSRVNPYIKFSFLSCSLFGIKIIENKQFGVINMKMYIK